MRQLVKIVNVETKEELVSAELSKTRIEAIIRAYKAIEIQAKVA
jgi:hypothetical protein